MILVQNAIPEDETPATTAARVKVDAKIVPGQAGMIAGGHHQVIRINKAGDSSLVDG